MKQKTALRVRKIIPNKYVNSVEKVVVEVGEVVEQFEVNLVSDEIAQSRISGILKKALDKKIIAPSNVPQILEIAEKDKKVYHYLKNKHKKEAV